MFIRLSVVDGFVFSVFRGRLAKKSPDSLESSDRWRCVCVCVCVCGVKRDREEN